MARAVHDIEKGFHDGALGSGVFKRRLARRGSGKSGGHRVVVVVRIGERAFLVEAFAKNAKSTHLPQEVRALRALADVLLALSDAEIDQASRAGALRRLEERQD